MLRSLNGCWVSCYLERSDVKAVCFTENMNVFFTDSMKLNLTPLALVLVIVPVKVVLKAVVVYT